jgi:DNA-directed RNA polymerase specialized sigma24 family protein
MLSQHDKEVIFHKFMNGSVKEKNIAIQLIYEEFQPVMFKKLRYKYQDLSVSEAQDIVQDAFIKLATTTSKPRSAESLCSWVITITENTALDLFKKAYKKNEIPLPEEVDIEDDENDTLNLVELSWISEFDIQDCVSKGIYIFSKKFSHNAAVISMSLDSMSISQIAEVISRTEGATKQFIYESKKKLAPYIEHCLEN